MAGRYLDHQVPFVGINYATPVGRYAAVLRDDLRLKVGKAHYISVIANCVLAAEGFRFGGDENSFFKEGAFHYGAGLEYAYDSIIGPLKLDVHWSDINKKVGAYFSVGFDF